MNNGQIRPALHDVQLAISRFPAVFFRHQHALVLQPLIHVFHQPYRQRRRRGAGRALNCVLPALPCPFQRSQIPDGCGEWLTRHFQEVDERTPAGKLGWRGLKNHDFVNDAMDHRLEKDVGAPLMDCALALNFTGRGVPYLYCGHEIGDVTRHSILGNLVAPQCHADHWFALFEVLCELIDSLRCHPGIDAARIYVTGCSTGGFTA